MFNLNNVRQFVYLWHMKKLLIAFAFLATLLLGYLAGYGEQSKVIKPLEDYISNAHCDSKYPLPYLP